MSAAQLGPLLRRFWWLIAASILLGVLAAGLLVRMQPPSYVSTVRLMAVAQSVLGQDSLMDRMTTLEDMTGSDSVRHSASAELERNGGAGLSAGSVTVSNPSSTYLLLVTASASTPEAAQAGAAALSSATTHAVSAVYGSVPSKTERLSLVEIDPAAAGRPKRAVPLPAAALVGAIAGAALAVAAIVLLAGRRRSPDRPNPLLRDGIGGARTIRRRTAPQEDVPGSAAGTGTA